jgi:hypothetical protein
MQESCKIEIDIINQNHEIMSLIWTAY